MTSQQAYWISHVTAFSNHKSHCNYCYLRYLWFSEDLSTVCLFLLSIYLVLVNAGSASIDLLDATHPWQSVTLVMIDNKRIDTELRLNEHISSNHSLPISLFHEVKSHLPLDILKSFLDYHNQCNNFHPYMLLKVSIRMDFYWAVFNTSSKTRVIYTYNYILLHDIHATG